MATNSCRCSTAARRLSDLLDEQQEEPFLILHLLLQDHDDDSATPARRTTEARTRNLLRGRGSTAATVTKLALRWADDVFAGCFSFPRSATRQRFRRPLRAEHGDVVAPAHCHDGDCGRQQLSLSPVSVLDLHSDDESSPVPNHRDDEHSDDDGSGRKPSTSATRTWPSPPSIHDLPGKTRAMEAERFQRNSVAFAAEWESVAEDISRIPSLVEHDISGSPRDDWHRRLVVGGGGVEEARQVARSIEAMIFEEVRWEAVRDMLCLRRY